MQNALNKIVHPGIAMLAGKSLKLTPLASQRLVLDLHLGVREDLVRVAPLMAAGITSALRWQLEVFTLSLEATACGDGLVAAMLGQGTDSLALRWFIGWKV